MKRFFALIILAFSSMLLYAQENPMAAFENTMHLYFYQTAKSYTTKAIDFDAFYSKKPEHPDVTEGHNHFAPPSFSGGDHIEFPRMLSKKLIESMSKDKIYSFDLRIDFVISEDGKFADVKIASNDESEDVGFVKSVINDFIANKSHVWYPKRFFGTNYSTPVSLILMAKNYRPNVGYVHLGSEMSQGFHEEVFYDLVSQAMKFFENRK
ncbi:MAG: hypothetical protein MJZ16_00975 [Bacteroidales bacterium]|nr:hypothetical protein [Bacteroidales bacterium]